MAKKEEFRKTTVAGKRILVLGRGGELEDET
jgi:hypothetical protein